MQKWFGKIVGAVMVGVMALGLVAPVMVGSGVAEAAYMNNVIPDGGGGGGSNQGQGGQQQGGSGTSQKESPETSILDPNLGVEGILKLVLNIVVYGLGAAAVIGVVVAGIMYMTARDSEAQVAKAKTRLFEIVVGLVAWALMYAVLNWLLPGGLNLS